MTESLPFEPTQTVLPAEPDAALSVVREATTLAIPAGAYEMRGTYGHIRYRRERDPQRTIYGVPVEVVVPQTVEYRCSFVLQVGRELRPGVWAASLRGASFELCATGEDAFHGRADFPDGTAGTLFIGREMGFGRRPVLLATRSPEEPDGAWSSKTFAGEIAFRAMRAAILSPAADDPDLTSRSPSAAR